MTRPKTYQPKRREARLINEVLDVFRYAGFLAWPTLDAHRATVSVVVTGGRLVQVLVVCGAREPTQRQLAWLNAVTLAGGFSVLVRCRADVVRLLDYCTGRWGEVRSVLWNSRRPGAPQDGSDDDVEDERVEDDSCGKLVGVGA